MCPCLSWMRIRNFPCCILSSFIFHPCETVVVDSSFVLSNSSLDGVCLYSTIFIDGFYSRQCCFYHHIWLIQITSSFYSAHWAPEFDWICHLNADPLFLFLLKRYHDLQFGEICLSTARRWMPLLSWFCSLRQLYTILCSVEQFFWFILLLRHLK